MELKEKILNFAKNNKTFKTADLVNKFQNKYTRQYLSSLVNDLVRKEILTKAGITANAVYALKENSFLLQNSIKNRYRRDKIEEHEVFKNLTDQNVELRSLKENVESIFFYAFTEMLNNAIDHSKSKFVDIEVGILNQKLNFSIRDFGIGVFRNIMSKRKLNSEFEAMQDLLKGKVTTMPRSHSGEGIFFTSKIADNFILESFGHELNVNNNIDDTFFKKIKNFKKGTRVVFEIDINSNKHLSDLFKEFSSSNKNGFDKTEILVRLFVHGSMYISRSQAKRILSGLEKYKVIVLDFEKVSTVGQAFADEIFRIFKNNHPEIKIKAINMIEPVKFMIERSKNT